MVNHSMQTPSAPAAGERRPHAGSTRLLFLVNDAHFFVSHRLPVAQAALAQGFEVHAATAGGDAVKTIEAHCIRHHSLRLSRNGLNPLQEIRAFAEIYRLMRRLRPHIVHLVTIKPVLYGGIAARLVGVPAVVAAISGLGHIYSVHHLRTRIMRVFVTAAYRIALRHRHLQVIFQNGSDRDVLMRSGAVASNKVVTIRGSGADLRDYCSSPEPSGLPVVTFAARFLKAKGVCEFVDAARRLRAGGMQARFLLVGDVDRGNSDSVSESEVAQWRAEGAVEVLGFRSNIAEIFAASNLIVLPSYYGEGLPKVLIEAAACGRAVITTDMPGCRDAIEPGITGLLIAPRDVDALARAVTELLADHERRRRMGLAGRALAEREYAIEGITTKHLQIYRKLIAGLRNRY